MMDILQLNKVSWKVFENCKCVPGLCFNDATRILNDITLNLGDLILLVIIYYLINKFQVIAGITLCCQSSGNHTNFDCVNKVIAYI